MDPPVDVADTFLTERQAQVLALRAEGLTQREIARRLGTSVANVSGVESAARRNVAAATHTLDLADLLESAVRITVAAGTDLRDLVDEIYRRGDEAGIRVAYAEPELTSRLHELVGPRVEARTLTEPVEVGITAAGRIVSFPSGGRADERGRADR